MVRLPSTSASSVIVAGRRMNYYDDYLIPCEGYRDRVQNASNENILRWSADHVVIIELRKLPFESRERPKLQDNFRGAHPTTRSTRHSVSSVPLAVVALLCRDFARAESERANLHSRNCHNGYVIVVLRSSSDVSFVKIFA